MKFLDFLRNNSERSIFVDPCSGNNGDLLIWHGMQDALRKTAIEPVADASEAQLIIVNGGGMFIDAYGQGIEKILTYTNLYPDTPLCIAPNSFHFQTVDFGAVLDSRTCPLHLFSRELYSKAYIDELAATRNHVFSHIDHDLAFQLQRSEWIDRVLTDYPKSRSGTVLVVDRMDIENPKAGGRPGYLRKIYAFLPEQFRVGLRAIRVSRRNKAGSHFTRRAKNLLEDRYPDHAIDRLETKDISRNDLCTFDEFVKKVAEAEFIFTNRLHVGILGYLLGRRVFLEEGSYHKIKGIYEYSMADSDHVDLMPDGQTVS